MLNLFFSDLSVCSVQQPCNKSAQRHKAQSIHRFQLQWVSDDHKMNSYHKTEMHETSGQQTSGRVIAQQCAEIAISSCNITFLVEEGQRGVSFVCGLVLFLLALIHLILTNKSGVFSRMLVAMFQYTDSGLQQHDS